MSDRTVFHSEEEYWAGREHIRDAQAARRIEPTTHTTTNYFTQMSRAAEMMAEHDAKMERVIKELQAEGGTLVSITYEY